MLDPESLTRRTAVVVAHGPCLDGATAAACVARAYGPARVTAHFTHPSDIDAFVRELGLPGQPPGDLWITDIGWKDDTTDALLATLAGAGWRVYWIDHHSSAIERAERGLDGLRLAGHRITRAFSGAKLTYDFLVDGAPAGALPELRRFEPIVLMADDTDRWIHRIPGSRELARAIGAMTTTDAYEELLRVEPGAAYPPILERALVESAAQLAKSLELATKTRARRPMPGGLTLVTCLCDGYVSEVADYLRQFEGAAVFAIYNAQGRRVSLRRSDGSEIDLATLAGAFGGGGHPAASGFDLPEIDAMIVAEVAARTATALDAQLQRGRASSAS